MYRILFRWCAFEFIKEYGYEIDVSVVDSDLSQNDKVGAL